MAHRDRTTGTKSDSFDYCILEVLLTKKDAPAGTIHEVRLVTVDNHLETLNFVQENMAACINNIVRLKRTDVTRARER